MSSLGSIGVSPTSRRLGNGFTLLELLIVMVIITIAFSALRPSFAGAVRGAQERTALRQLVGMFTAARTEAVARGKLVRIAFDPNEGVFYAEVQTDPAVDRTAFEPLSLVNKRRVRLPEHLSVGRLRVGGQDIWDQTAMQIYFYPDGRTDGAVLELVDSYGGSIEMEVAPATGRVRLNA